MRPVGDQAGFDVLYIAGTARSGSTILAILLGAAPGVVAAGELSFFFRDVAPGRRTCSCRRATSECPLWSRVLAASGWTAREITELNEVTRSIDAHKSVPGLALGMVSPTRLARYCEAHARVVGALQQASGAHVVVDSSKYVARALALGRCFGGRLRILCLTRRPEGVIHSFLKPNPVEQKRSSVRFAAAYYPAVLAQLRILTRAHAGPVLELSYERLCRDPTGTLAAIERWSGLDLSQPRERLMAGAAFDVGHLVTANRLRERGSVSFRPERGVDLAGRGARLTARLLEGWRRLLGFR